MRKTLTDIAVLIILFGMSGFLFNTLFVSQGSFIYKGELPLTGIQGIIEKNGKIYIGLGESSRIQVYNLDGKFIEYIKTPNYSKDFDFQIDENGSPTVNVIYIREKSIEKYIQQDGSEYKISSKIPILLEKKDSFGKHIKIRQPLHMSLWGGSINCWLIGLMGVVFFVIINSTIIMNLAGMNITKEERMKLFFKRIFL